jgi:hypothetical protein
MEKKMRILLSCLFAVFNFFQALGEVIGLTFRDFKKYWGVFVGDVMRMSYRDADWFLHGGYKFKEVKVYGGQISRFTLNEGKNERMVKSVVDEHWENKHNENLKKSKDMVERYHKAHRFQKIDIKGG